MAKSVLGLWAAVVIAVAACSGSTTTSGNFGDGGGGGGSVTAGQACTDLANTICTTLQSCLPLYTQLLYGDMATCTARTKLTCPATLGASGTGLTPASVEACASAVGSTSCTDLFAGNTPSACVTHGSLMQGAACADNAQCAGANSYCNIAPGQTCGVCGMLAAAGGSCISKRDCRPGLECGKGTGASSTSAGICVTAGEAGATCDAPHPCRTSFACVNGTCAQAAAAGAACNPVTQNCDASQLLFCDPGTSLCKTLKTASAGGSCGLSFLDASFTVCTAGANCKTAMESTTGTCEAPAADGAMCDGTGMTGPKCLPPAVCANGACKIPDPASCR